MVNDYAKYCSVHSRPHQWKWTVKFRREYPHVVQLLSIIYCLLLLCIKVETTNNGVKSVSAMGEDSRSSPSKYSIYGLISELTAFRSANSYKTPVNCMQKARANKCFVVGTAAVALVVVVKYCRWKYEEIQSTKSTHQVIPISLPQCERDKQSQLATSSWI
jgi:hypothetical protein